MRILYFIFFLINSIAFAQENNEDTAEDSRWKVEGKVLDKINKEMIKAKIVYESLPYGGNIGFYDGHTFIFQVPEETEYRLKVVADGYSPYFHDIKLSEFQNGVYSTIIELIPNDMNRLIRLDKLIFELGKANITGESYAELNNLAEMMQQNPEMIIQLEGHTDFRGSARQNIILSEKRVEAVKNYLASEGVEKRRIKTKAFGGTKPLNRNDDAESREKNRRVEVRIISN